MAIDGSPFELPDEADKLPHFGRPGELKVLLAQRLAEAMGGDVSTQSITDIAEEAIRSGGAA